MKTILLIATIFFVTLHKNSLFGQDHPIYALEQKLLKGDKSALFHIATYFDSRKEMTEFLGHHIIETTESVVAKRITEENCSFTAAEMTISKSTSTNDFLTFLNSNNSKITFSKMAEAFLITPFELRNSRVEFREMTGSKKTALQAKYPELLSKEWVKKAKIDSLISERNSEALLRIASELYKLRYRFNAYHPDKHEFTELLQTLLGNEIAVDNEKKELTWHIDKAFYPDASLNLLIYFAGNHTQFKWNEASATFKNESLQIKTVGKEASLFQLLNSKEDSVALNAFIQLTRCNPATVSQLANEYEKAGIDKSWAIPIFPYPFLKQLSALTDYCKQNNIDFEGSAGLKRAIDQLDSNLTFRDRRKLEDSLINHLPIEEITAFEYWAAIKEQSWGTTYSAGRILDIFYSKHWNKILNTKRYLQAYLKKSHLFDQLGIIGICNSYLVKFTNMGDLGIHILTSLETGDADIKYQIEKAKTLCKQTLKVPHDTLKVNNGNRDYNILNIAAKIKAIKKIGNQDTMEDKLVELLSKINYTQIGDALRAIEDIQFKERRWKKYSFMERDWGFLIDDNFDTLPARTAFLNLYDKLTEFELYTYYLDNAAIDYKNKDNSLNYNKIFDILKYNVVVAFVGGGGGKLDNEVYAIIKILELTHKTTLGYPKKLCNSGGMYGCDAQDRANEWMLFLKEKKLVAEQSNEPVSFHYE